MAGGVPAFAVVGIDYNGRWDLYRCCFFSLILICVLFLFHVNPVDTLMMVTYNYFFSAFFFLLCYHLFPCVVLCVSHSSRKARSSDFLTTRPCCNKETENGGQRSHEVLCDSIIGSLRRGGLVRRGRLNFTRAQTGYSAEERRGQESAGCQTAFLGRETLVADVHVELRRSEGISVQEFFYLPPTCISLVTRAGISEVIAWSVTLLTS